MAGGIIEFYKGKNVFITGATGFMGKILIEKLLRSCPDIGNIYILVRSKKGKDPSTRIKEIINQTIFDVLRRVNPENFKKIIPVLGDCSELGLGLSFSDRQLLEENVSVVFHCAANVKFDDPLKDAILLNTRGTREMMLLVRNIKNLKIFVHVSTAYCNCDRLQIEEIIYPPHGNWRDFIKMAECVDEYTLDILTSKLMRNLPNTYVFTKSLAEHVVKDLGENLPVMIIRPSIVVSCLEEPIPGWIDNFNGPVGITVATGKGILRSIYASPDIVSDYVAVDVCIKGMIFASWYKAVCGDSSEISVYNSSNNGIISLTTQEVIQLGLKLTAETPLEDVVWHPNAAATDNEMIYFLYVIFLHLIPALIIDQLLKFSGKRPMLTKIQRKIYTANMALSYFTTKMWVIKNEKSLGLRKHMLKSDKKEFSLDYLEDVNPEAYFKSAILGARVHLLKEPEKSIPRSLKHFKRMYWIDRSVRVIVIGLVSWIFYWNVMSIIWR